MNMAHYFLIHLVYLKLVGAYCHQVASQVFLPSPFTMNFVTAPMRQSTLQCSPMWIMIFSSSRSAFWSRSDRPFLGTFFEKGTNTNNIQPVNKYKYTCINDWSFAPWLPLAWGRSLVCRCRHRGLPGDAKSLEERARTVLLRVAGMNTVIGSIIYESHTLLSYQKLP